METRLRMLLVLAGLPRPDLQISLRDDNGLFIARADLYYRTRRIAIKYDRGAHRDSLADDNRRQNRLLSAGYQLLRFTASDVCNSPDIIVVQVRAALKRQRK
jgi:very-short-patch-repair endonuclease